MKILHASLDTFLEEVETGGQAVRVAALMQSAMTPAMTAPLYASWIVVTAALAGGSWAEWRILVGRQRAELTERSYPVPSRLTTRTEERLAEVRQRVASSGLAVAHGILAHDGETVDGVLE